MELITAISYSVFLLACFGLVWTLLRVYLQSVTIIAKVAAKKDVTWDFSLELWLMPLCFAAIMGFIFIL